MPHDAERGGPGGPPSNRPNPSANRNQVDDIRAGTSATDRLRDARQGQLQWLPPGARTTDPATSHAAAVDTPDRSRLRAELLTLLRDRGSEGAIDDELWQAVPGALLGSVAKRRHDLVAMGLVTDSGLRRMTRRGCAAVVWVTIEHAAVHDVAQAVGT